ncbi:MAG TPA: sulfotransferase [Candidatus Limnocylindria bacterium]|nr:sulfotransferase [Candidatus Limnocylindria bacterium]
MSEVRPNFFIVGAPRCGTTAMYEYLRQHPDVFMPYRKEPVFFGSDLTKRRPPMTEAEYLELFRPGASRSRRGEATVWYLYSQTAPGEIRAFSQDPRIIIMLRNPVDMMYSLHSQLFFSANEDLADFGAAIAAEEDRRQGRRMPPRARRPEGLQYRACGRYAAHVRRYLEAFGPDAVRVIIYDDFSSDAAASYRQTLAFLGVDPSFQPDFSVVNRSKAPRSRWLQQLTYAPWFMRTTARLPKPVNHLIRRSLKRLNFREQPRTMLDPQLRARLTQEMAPDVAELGELLGRDLSSWSHPPTPSASAA